MLVSVLMAIAIKAHPGWNLNNFALVAPNAFGRLEVIGAVV